MLNTSAVYPLKVSCVLNLGQDKTLATPPACTSLPWYAELAKGRVASGVRYDGGPSSASNADKAEGKPDWTGPAEQSEQLINCMNSATDGLPACSYHYLRAHGLAVYLQVLFAVNDLPFDCREH